MQIKHSNSADAAVDEMSRHISSALNSGKRVLWLLCGGSNIPTAVKSMQQIRARAREENLINLTVSLTDERYGPVGHPDSNWRQLSDAGFDWSGIASIAVLSGLSLQETAAHYGRNIEMALSTHHIAIAQFGIGPDGHIAAILPHSPAVSSAEPACGYESEPFTRITLTFPVLRKLTTAYAFVFGASKQTQIFRLKDESLPLDVQPAQILKEIPGSVVYTDQI